MNILVFGKDGQLGKAFKALLEWLPISAHFHVAYVGRAECDLSNEEQLIAQLQASHADLIINAAAYTAVDKAEVEIEMAYAINAKAPELMARYAKEKGATFLHFSTDRTKQASGNRIGDEVTHVGISFRTMVVQPLLLLNTALLM